MKPYLLLLFVSVAWGGSCLAAGDEMSETPAHSSPSLAPIVDDPKLPRVLLIGDSISIGYTLPTRADLEGVANVHRPPTNCGSTRSGLDNLDKWIGDEKWDVIHFNWGMHDLKYLESGKQNVPLPQYEKSLRELVDRLQKTGATLIFATTTPLPHDTNGKFKRMAGAEEEYNAAAIRIMKENGVMVDDLHGLAAPQIDKIISKDGVHYNASGYVVLARQVADTISQALDKRKKGQTSEATK